MTEEQLYIVTLDDWRCKDVTTFIMKTGDKHVVKSILLKYSTHKTIAFRDIEIKPLKFGDVEERIDESAALVSVQDYAGY